jgi:hypothetical protein
MQSARFYKLAQKFAKDFFTFRIKDETLQKFQNHLSENKEDAIIPIALLESDNLCPIKGIPPALAAFEKKL